jgi:hypothetical protein
MCAHLAQRRDTSRAPALRDLLVELLPVPVVSVELPVASATDAASPDTSWVFASRLLHGADYLRPVCAPSLVTLRLAASAVATPLKVDRVVTVVASAETRAAT